MVAVVISSSAHAKTINQTSTLDDTQLIEFSPQLSVSYRATLTTVLLELYPHFTDEDLANLVEEFDQHLPASNEPIFIHQPEPKSNSELIACGVDAIAMAAAVAIACYVWFRS